MDRALSAFQGLRALFELSPSGRPRRLVFGLQTTGVGVVNLVNLVRFSVHPEPVGAAIIGFASQGDAEQKQRPGCMESDPFAATLQIKQV